ncbi:amino acid adenylation domain-containing protein, partial [Streptomyces sp. SID10244]|nr:amino acid adenylation domain-containing protein [Streptomyces sp. SID10244]
YGEFDAQVNALGRSLIAAGIGPDDAVGVCLPRSIEMLVAVHAITVAGGQYVPIDTEAPADRVRYMTDTASVTTILIGPGGIPAAI